MLATLLDRTDGEAVPLTPALADRYGGELRFRSRGRPLVFANFVSTIDGIVSFGLPGRAQASVISGGHPADRFVLALLRAVADAVVVGAGTLREEPGVIWTSEAAFPEAGGEFARLRAELRKAPRPLTILVSASGRVDPRSAALAEGAPVVILTTERGASALAGVGGHVRVRRLERGTTEEMVAVAAEESGGSAILSEGGPTLFGQFLREGTIDELFLTVAPRVAGRSTEEPRVGLVQGTAFAPEAAPGARLLSVKSADDYLLLRFATR